MPEFRVRTTSGYMRIAANSRKEANKLAEDDGHNLHPEYVKQCIADEYKYCPECGQHSLALLETIVTEDEVKEVRTCTCPRSFIVTIHRQKETGDE